MAYLLDANCFIQVKKWYGLDFCPGYWDWLDRENGAGNLYSIDKVRDEILAGNDDLAAWARQRGPNFFLSVDNDAANRVQQIATWLTQSSGLAPHQISEFLSGADPWLIGFALAHNHTVVTNESLVASNSKKVKVPNICQQFGVVYTALVPVIQQSGVRLKL